MRKFLTPESGPSKPRVYFASPLPTYWTDRYEQRAALVRRRFEDAVLVEPRHLFHDAAGWRAEWPSIVRSIDAVVFIADIDGSIGYGVFREVREAQVLGVPVWLLSDRGHFHGSYKLSLIDGGMSWRRYAHVSLARGQRRG